MASVEVFGFEYLNAFFDTLGEVPFRVTAQALEKMAEIGEDAVASAAVAYGVFDPTSRTHIVNSIYHTKPKANKDGGGYCVVTFRGDRRRGRTVTKNALIAFENEYGNRHQAPRPFVRLAAAQRGEEMASAGEIAFFDWMDELTRGG